MPGSATSEIIFIAAMMVLILIICSAAVYFFFKTYAKEKRDRTASSDAKLGDAAIEDGRINEDAKSGI